MCSGLERAQGEKVPWADAATIPMLEATLSGACLNALAVRANSSALFAHPSSMLGDLSRARKNAHSPIRPSSSTPLTPEYQCCFLSVGGSVPACEKNAHFCRWTHAWAATLICGGEGERLSWTLVARYECAFFFFAPDGKDSGLPAKFSFKRWWFATLGRHGGGMCSWTCVGLWCVGNASFKAAGRDSGFALNTVFKHSSFAPPWRAPRCARAALRSFVAPASLLTAIDRGCALVGSLPLRRPLRGLARQRHGAAPHARGIGLYRGPRRRG